MGICKEIAGVCNFSENVWGLDVYYGQVYISPKEMADYIRENDMYSVCQYLKVLEYDDECLTDEINISNNIAQIGSEYCG